MTMDDDYKQVDLEEAYKDLRDSNDDNN